MSCCSHRQVDFIGGRDGNEAHSAYLMAPIVENGRRMLVHRYAHEQMHWFHTSSSAVAMEVFSAPRVVGRGRASMERARALRRGAYTVGRLRGRAMVLSSLV